MTALVEIGELCLNLHRLAKEAAELGSENVAGSGLFTEDFMETYTTFSSLDELLQGANFIVDPGQDMVTIVDDRFDGYIRSTTKFNCWPKILTEARNRWIRAQLF